MPLYSCEGADDIGIGRLSVWHTSAFLAWF